MKQNIFCRMAAALLAGFLSVQPSAALSCTASDLSKTADASVLSAAPSAETDEPDYYTLKFDRRISYSDYYDKYADAPTPDTELMLYGTQYTAAEHGTFSVGTVGENADARENILIWNSPQGELSYTLAVEKAGVYCAEFSYYALKSPSNAIEFELLIDGTLPFESAARISLNKIFVNKTEIKTDARGNQIRPSQIEQPAWQTAFLYDADGLFNTPLRFYLSAGTHTITLRGVKANLGIESIRFCQPKQPPVHQPPSEQQLAQTPSTRYRLEGEAAVYKSAPTLCPAYDNNSYLISPSDPVKMVYNTIGGENWNHAGQTITWEIPEDALSRDGYYRLGIKARQNVMRGFYSNRRIYIDGEVADDAFSQVRFYYDTDWNLTVPSAQNGDSAFFFLSAGQKHTITLEAIPGEIGESMRYLESVVSDLNTCYQQILMITGPNPDPYNDYYVQESVPTLLTDFKRLSDALKAAQNGIETLSGTLGSEAAALQRMYVILDKCLEKPSRIPSYVTQMKDNISTISTFICDYRNQPLEIDYLELTSADTEFSPLKENFFRQLAFRWKAFFGSFGEEYTTLSDLDTEDEDVIEVWVNLGRDQALVVKELVENDFAQQYPDIPIAVNLVVGGVVEATLADEGPDVALFLGGEFPINLACRDLLVDLSRYDDIEGTLAPFHPEAAVPYTYNGNIYGIPLTQSWTMLFYRTDILSDLGFETLPRTWEDLVNMLPALQRRHLGVGLVLPNTNVAPSTEAGHTFAALMLQSGLNYYDPRQTKTMFDTVTAVQCFEQWTDFYTDYKFAQTYDPYSYFRTGQYPMVIANYSFANQLTVAAPEIRGLWDFTVMPGTVRPDGTFSHASNSSGTGAVIFRQVEHPDDAWTFVKWFCSTEVQAEYGANIEGLLGQMGRYEAANFEALSKLNWSAKELDVLKAQWESLEEIPILPASYAVTRNIMNAFRETVNDNENPRDTLMYYNSDMNDEIRRKRENLGLE